MRWVPSSSTARPPAPVRPARSPVPLPGTITRNSASRLAPRVVAEWAKLNVPERPPTVPSKLHRHVRADAGGLVEGGGEQGGRAAADVALVLLLHGGHADRHRGRDGRGGHRCGREAGHLEGS